MEDAPLTIAALRKELGLSLDAFAAEVGLKSKGQASEIEKSNACSPHVALAVERLSARRIDAASLNPVIRAARAPQVETAA
ncbi:MAG: hypothetical protein INR68_16720 [Methylobacterium mesophilicum]|nr:hypothetical protein [Methylobacterium mesophilicum]